MERSQQLLLFLTVFLSVLASTDASVKSLLLFGDSLFDAGNNPFLKNCSIQCNFPPYGSVFFNRPTGRFTNGRTVPDFIAQYLGIEFQKPFQEIGNISRIPANGINFASSGSGVFPETNRDAKVTPIQVQLQQLQALIDQKRLQQEQIANSVFFLVSGSNDIFSYFLPRGARYPDVRTYVDLMLNEVVTFLDKIYKIGARRIGVFSVGPMGCIPARALLLHINTKQCVDRINDMAKSYNDGLESLVNNIPKKYPNVVGVYGAVYNIVQKILADPKRHGFVNINEACCGRGFLNGMLQCGTFGYKMCRNANEFFFWDYFHPTEHAYKLIAESMWSGDKNQIRPMNLKAFTNLTV